MQHQNPLQPAGKRARPLIAALVSAASCSAWADDPNPYYIGINESVTYTSNAYGIPNGIPLPSDRSRSDIFGGGGLVGGFDQNIGRQHVYGAAKVNLNRYARNKELNNTSYDVNAGWDWATIENLTGSFNVDANQSLQNQNNNGGVRPTLRANILNTELIAARVRWGGDSALNLDAGYAYNRVSYSVTDTQDSTQNSASLGGSYAVGPTLRLGVALRVSRSEQPKYAFVFPDTFESNTADGRYLDLTAAWTATAQTGLNVRVSWTRLTNSFPGAADFSGLTGALSGTYAPTAKLSFNASVSREAGINSLFLNVVNPPPGQPSSVLSQSNQITAAFSLGASYAATAKIGVNAGVQYLHNKVPDQVNGNSGNTYGDNTFNASLGVSYAIARNWSAGCNLTYSSRDVSGNILPYSYTTNTVGCNAQFTLQ